MAIVFVTPTPGLVVRKETGEVLKPEGEALPLTPWWIRRANDCDVILSDPAPAGDAPKPKK